MQTLGRFTRSAKHQVTGPFNLLASQLATSFNVKKEGCRRVRAQGLRQTASAMLAYAYL
jgi:hypothetical protein